MSADNGIYILQSTDGYRVLYAMAIENMDWIKDDSARCGYRHAENEKELQIANSEYWRDAPFFQTKAEALTYAAELEEKHTAYDDYLGCCLPLEYGISLIRVPFAIIQLELVK